ncbi:MAG: hypothetical protein ABSC16_14350 [Candidatus Dormibacteria bacterium]|jgi:hypothetical protein|nr:hypothetical protein [Chloroflexota bacterium]
MRTLTVSNRTKPTRLAAEIARLLAGGDELLAVGEGSRVDGVMHAAELVLASQEPRARCLLVESAGRRRAWWWAIDGRRGPAAAWFTTALWPSVARRGQAARRP